MQWVRFLNPSASPLRCSNLPLTMPSSIARARSGGRGFPQGDPGEHGKATSVLPVESSGRFFWASGAYLVSPDVNP